MLSNLYFYKKIILYYIGLNIYVLPNLMNAQVPVSGTVGIPSVGVISNSAGQTVSSIGCSPSSGEGALVNVNITMQKISTAITANGTTNASGIFSFTFPSTGLVSNTPAYSVNDTFVNVTTFDIALISKHILKVEPIACPYRRIAADLDLNGIIDTNDMTKLRLLILRAAPASWPIYRFVSKAFVLPAKKHPDQQFLADFWSSEFADADGSQYPFNAKFRYNNKTYTYNGAQKWMDFLAEWQIPSDSCVSSSNWGFIGIKMGDVNGNYGGLPLTSGPVVSLQNTAPSTNSLLKGNTLSNKLTKNKEYRIILRGTSQDAVSSFQIQLKGDTKKIEVLSAINCKDGLDIVASRDINTSAETIANGRITAAWLCDFTQFKEGIKLNDTPLFSLLIRVKDDTDLNSISLDNADFLNCFFGNDGNAIKTDIRLEIAESQ